VLADDSVSARSVFAPPWGPVGFERQVPTDAAAPSLRGCLGSRGCGRLGRHGGAVAINWILILMQSAGDARRRREVEVERGCRNRRFASFPNTLTCPGRQYVLHPRHREWAERETHMVDAASAQTATATPAQHFSVRGGTRVVAHRRGLCLVGRHDSGGGTAASGRFTDMRFGSVSRWPPRTLAARAEMNRCYRIGRNTPSIDRGTLTGMLLEEFIATRRYVPEEATPIRRLDDLPLRLRRLAQGLNGQWQWRAWSSGPRIWFVTAQIVSGPRLESQEHGLRVLFFDGDGLAEACSEWLRRSPNRWVLYRLLEPAHYCDSLGVAATSRQLTNAI